MNRQQIHIKNQLNELHTLRSSLESFFGQHQVSGQIASELQLAAEEIVVNTIHYGYRDKQEHQIEIEVLCDQQVLTLTFIDDARPFNPLAETKLIDGLPMGVAESGGLGIALILSLSDHQQYQYKDGQNIFGISKTITTMG